MNSINFVVISPQPVYIDYIGGVTVAHTLANELNKHGQNVYLYADSTHSNYNIQCIPWGTKVDFDNDNTIVILIAGDGDHTFLHNIPDFFKNAKHIVRWQVNHQLETYPSDNKFYKFHKYWDNTPNQQIDGYLSVIEVDRELFRNKNKNRSGTCYLMKGHLDTEQDRAIHTERDLCIDNYLYSTPNRLQYLSDVFNEHEVFISYTHLTFASVLAALCGCVSVIIPKSDFDKEKFMNEIWCDKYGIAIGLDDIPRAKETLPLVPQMLDDYINITQMTQVKQFITDCYDWLNLDIKQ